MRCRDVRSVLLSKPVCAIVNDSQVKHNTTYLERLSQGAEVLLHQQREYYPRLCALASQLRATVAKDAPFENCVALRGTSGRRVNLRLIPQDSLAIMWKRREQPRRVYSLHPSQIRADLNLEHWCLLVYWIEDTLKPSPDIPYIGDSDHDMPEAPSGQGLEDDDDVDLDQAMRDLRSRPTTPDQGQVQRTDHIVTQINLSTWIQGRRLRRIPRHIHAESVRGQTDRRPHQRTLMI